MLVGMASACHTMRELRERVAEKFGRQEIQMPLFLLPGQTVADFYGAPQPPGENQ
jgi:hypothetical protein